LGVTKRFVVVANVSSTFLRRLFETERTGSDGNAIAVLQLLLKLGIAVDEDFVCAPAQLAVNYGAIDNCEGTVVVILNVRVVARCSRVIQDHCVIWGAADRANGLRNKIELPLTATCISDFQVSHAGIDPNSTHFRLTTMFRTDYRKDLLAISDFPFSIFHLEERFWTPAFPNVKRKMENDQ
jgi:hypothetical protein